MFNSVSSFKNLTTHILIIACLCSQYSCDEPVLDNIFDGDITPGIEIENEGLNGSEINTSDITLDWSGNDFSFEFSYLLEPRDADWSDWDSTMTAYYDYLDEGPYVFKVKGRFDENEEQETPDSILFNVNAIDGPGLRVYPLYKSANTGEEFDVLTLFHSFEHITDPFRYLKNLRKLLRKEGSLVVQVPNVGSLQARIFGSRWYGLDCPRHIYNYSTFSLLHVLGRAGYRILRVRHFSLRDNSAALVSSLFPFLDPMSQRVKLLRRKGKIDSLGLRIKTIVYFGLFVLAQPFALLEAALGRGGTVTVYAKRD